MQPLQPLQPLVASDSGINWQSELDRNIAILPTLAGAEQAEVRAYIEHARKMVREQLGTATTNPTPASTLFGDGAYSQDGRPVYLYPGGVDNRNPDGSFKTQGVVADWFSKRAGDMGFAIAGGLIFVLGVGFVLYREAKKVY